MSHLEKNCCARNFKVPSGSSTVVVLQQNSEFKFMQTFTNLVETINVYKFNNPDNVFTCAPPHSQKVYRTRAEDVVLEQVWQRRRHPGGQRPSLPLGNLVSPVAVAVRNTSSYTGNWDIRYLQFTSLSLLPDFFFWHKVGTATAPLLLKIPRHFFSLNLTLPYRCE